MSLQESARELFAASESGETVHWNTPLTPPGTNSVMVDYSSGNRWSVDRVALDENTCTKLGRAVAFLMPQPIKQDKRLVASLSHIGTGL